MAIKFFFKPVAQSVAQVIADIQSGKTSKPDVLNYAKQFFQNNMMLPVNPEVLEITTASDNKKVNVVKSGEVVIPKGVRLSTLTIESFFPGVSTMANQTLNGYIPAYIIKAVNSIFDNFSAEQYFKYFETLQQTKVPVRLVISDCGVDMDVLVESIKQRYVSCDDDLHYTLNLVEYKEPKATKLITKKATTAEGVVNKVIPIAKPRTKKGLAVGDTVVVNGKYFYDSFGSKPYGTFKNFRGKISHMASNSKATNKYHITTLDGGWRGWVTADQIQGVE